MARLVFSEPTSQAAFVVIVGARVIGEQVLTFRDLRSGAWRSGYDRMSYLWPCSG